MNWPITISQDKVAHDILLYCSSDFRKRDAIYKELGWRDCNTGPWSKFGYPWRWGTAKIDLFFLNSQHSPPEVVVIDDPVYGPANG